jgi:N6-adenosine-specific RNA methylase IME4
MSNLVVLDQWDKAKQAIAECQTIDEVKKIRNYAEALRIYVKQAKYGLEMQNKVAEIRIRAERRIGEFSKELPKGESTSHDGKMAILEDLDIKHYERCEYTASIPSEIFEAYIDYVKGENQELTSAAILRMAKAMDKKAKIDERIQNFKREKTESANVIDIHKTENKYNIILADPAWSYWEGGLRSSSQHYQTMNIDEIKALPVKNISADDCVLFLWVTWPILPEALDVIKEWGFSYSTCGFVWVKKNKNNGGNFFGMGSWTRANSEFCLIATKGRIDRLDNSISQIIESPIEEHSKKPDVVRELIVKLVGDLPKIELFSRQDIPGWDRFGNENLQEDNLKK